MIQSRGLDPRGWRGYIQGMRVLWSSKFLLCYAHTSAPTFSLSTAICSNFNRLLYHNIISVRLSVVKAILHSVPYLSIVVELNLILDVLIWYSAYPIIYVCCLQILFTPSTCVNWLPMGKTDSVQHYSILAMPTSQTSSVFLRIIDNK